jgi:hypothetical protein
MPINAEDTFLQAGAFPLDPTDKVFNDITDVETNYPVYLRYERLTAKIWKDELDHSKGIDYFFWNGTAFEKDNLGSVKLPNIWKIGTDLDFNNLQEANDSPLVQSNDHLYFYEDLTGSYNLTKKLSLYGVNNHSFAYITGSINSTEAITLINMRLDLATISTTSLLIVYDSFIDVEANAIIALRLYAYNSVILKAADGVNGTAYAFDLINIKEIRLYQNSSIKLIGSAFLFGSSSPSTVRTGAGKLTMHDSKFEGFSTLLGIFHPDLTNTNTPSAKLDYINPRFEDSSVIPEVDIDKGITVPANITKDLNCIIHTNTQVYQVELNKKRSLISNNASFPFLIEYPSNKTYMWRLTEDIRINSINALCPSGSCDVIVAINGTNVTPSASSLTSADQTLGINNANAVGLKGQYLEITFSSVIDAENVDMYFIAERVFL